MLDLTDFAVQERPEGNLMVAISQLWYNCSYTMAAKPIKSLELHYTMMQFLIIGIIPYYYRLEKQVKGGGGWGYFKQAVNYLPIMFCHDWKIALWVLYDNVGTIILSKLFNTDDKLTNILIIGTVQARKWSPNWTANDPRTGSDSNKTYRKMKECPGLHVSSRIYEENTNSSGFYNNNKNR